MLLCEFKRYCEQKKPCVIIYDSCNDSDGSAPCNYASYFEAASFILAFDSITILYNPNTICFIGECGAMYIHGVRSVSVNNDSVLGDIVTIVARRNTKERRHTFIFR